MKLYATITSERATKAQGGNKRLDVQLLVGNKFNPTQAGVLSVRPDPNFADTYVIIYWLDGQEKLLARIQDKEIVKGKQQKGEKCNHYGCGNFVESGSDYCIAH